MILAHTTLGAEVDDWVTEDSDMLFPLMRNTSSSFVCIHELFHLIPRVSILARQLATEKRLGLPTWRTLNEHSNLREVISGWEATQNDDEIYQQCGKLYQQALLVYLASSLEDVSDSDGTGVSQQYSSQVQDAFDSFLAIIDTIPLDSSISTSLCWPLAIFGSCARSDAHREIIRHRLDSLSDVYSARGVSDARKLLEALWEKAGCGKSNFKHNPLSLERVMRGSNTTVLLL